MYKSGGGWEKIRGFEAFSQRHYYVSSKRDIGGKYGAFAEDDLDGFGNRKRRSDARAVPKNALTIAPENGISVLRRGTVQERSLFPESGYRRMEQMARKKRED